MRPKHVSVLQCSFCRKSQAEHGVKLISSPLDYPRAYICDECVQICAAIVADDQVVPPSPAPEPLPPPPESPLGHPAAAELLSSVENWITRESSGADVSTELVQLRNLARFMFVHTDDR